MKKSKEISAACVALSMFLYSNTSVVQAAHQSENKSTVNNTVKSVKKITAITSVTSIAQVFGDGEKVAAIAIEYPNEIDAASISPADFSVAGKKITSVYTNDKAEYTDKNIPGRYVILNFTYINSTSDQPMHSMPPKNMMNKNDAPHFSDRKAPDLSITVMQKEIIKAANGTVYLPTNDAIKNTAQIDNLIDKFKQYEYTDPKTGYKIPYNLYLPHTYDPNKKYPLLFFIPDASANSDDVKMALIQGNGATVWATSAEQEKHECIILAPEYTNALISKIGMLTEDSNEWTKGLTLVSDLLFDVVNRYSVDENRIYGTGQSQGGMANIAISDKYPNFFAAQYLVACQWDVNEMEAIKDKKLWILVSQGDTKAHPGMNAATNRWETLGSKVARSDMWDSKSTAAQFDELVKNTRAKKTNINYTVFKGGNHNYTWSIAYNIEGIRDWLFEQTKTGEKVPPFGNFKHNDTARKYLKQGIEFYTGNNAEKNYKQALKYFHLADKHGDLKAGRYIGLCYENGYGVTKDYIKAVQFYQKAADNGDITATCYLGHMYEEGLGVEQNYDKAKQLYIKSAQRGDVIAAPGMVALGRLYENGLGVSKNTQEAEKWYQKAVDANYKDAQIDLERVKKLNSDSK